MDKCEKKKSPVEEGDKAVMAYPGIAVNRGDDDRVDSELQKERTEILGNNPND